MNLSEQKVNSWWIVIRDILAFWGGLAIVFYETLYENVDRPWLFAVAIGMMGLPAASKMDKWLREAKDLTNVRNKDS